MIFSQKIYFNDKPLIITTNREVYLEEYPVAEMYHNFGAATITSFAEALKSLELPDVNGAMIEGDSEAALKSLLSEKTTAITAGGGLVYNESDELLMIFRRGKWDLPKGKLDEGETIDDCAVREVQEETGLQHISPIDHLADTYHLYHQDDILYLKQTVWYRMKGTSTDELAPQMEENIQEVKWVAEKDLGYYVSHTYEAVRDILKTAGMRW